MKKIYYLLLFSSVISFGQTQIGADINGEAANDFNGWSVSLSSDGAFIAIGSPWNDVNGTDSGYVRVFQNISGVWTQVGGNINGASNGDKAGSSVSISSNGSIVAFGAFDDFSNYVRVFKNISGVWTQVGANINGEAFDDESGYSISLSSDGSVVAIGAIYNDGNGSNSGHVRVYKNISGTWIKIGNDIDGEAAGDASGYSVSLSSDGSVVAIGAIHNAGNGTNSGHVRVYKNVANVWTQVGADINGEAASDLSGLSVSLSANGAVIANGAPLNIGNGSYSGHVRVYDLSALLHSDTFVLDNFSIYPNPTSDFIKINLENNLTFEKVNIYNSLGQFIKSENNKTIEIKSLAKGNYFVEVITNQGKATKTIIIE